MDLAMENDFTIEELIKNKEYKTAIKKLEQKYKQSSDTSYVIKISDIYKLQKDNKKALKVLLDSYKKNPDIMLAKNIAALYFYSSNYKKAIEFYQAVIDLEGVSSGNLYNLGCSYHYNNNYIEAYKYYNNALKLNPKNISALNNLGCLYYETKNYKDALNTFRESISYLKDNPEAYFYLGILYRCFLKDLELSVLCFKKAMWYDSKHLETYLELIKTYKEQNNLEEIENTKKLIFEKFPEKKLAKI